MVFAPEVKLSDALLSQLLAECVVGRLRNVCSCSKYVTVGRIGLIHAFLDQGAHLTRSNNLFAFALNLPQTSFETTDSFLAFVAHVGDGVALLPSSDIKTFIGTASAG